MPRYEIERKFLVKDDSYKTSATESHRIIQGYLSHVPERTVRVRIFDDKGFITIKGKNAGARREEYEYEIPLTDAIDLLCLAEGLVLEKVRYIVPYKGHIWEVDCFEGALRGLSLAEVEMTDENAAIALPRFIGTEVTGDSRYYNSNLNPDTIP